MLSVERTRRLIETLQREGSLSVANAAKNLGVSASTIRRDLDQLERQGLISKVYGGAIVEGADDSLREPPRLAAEYRTCR